MIQFKTTSNMSTARSRRHLTDLPYIYPSYELRIVHSCPVTKFEGGLMTLNMTLKKMLLNGWIFWQQQCSRNKYHDYNNLPRWSSWFYGI